ACPVSARKAPAVPTLMPLPGPWRTRLYTSGPPPFRAIRVPRPRADLDRPVTDVASAVVVLGRGGHVPHLPAPLDVGPQGHVRDVGADDHVVDVHFHLTGGLGP